MNSWLFLMICTPALKSTFVQAIRIGQRRFDLVCGRWTASFADGPGRRWWDYYPVMTIKNGSDMS